MRASASEGESEPIEKSSAGPAGAAASKRSSAGRLPASVARGIVLAVLVPLLTLGTGGTPANAALTTLFTTMDVPRSVSGLSSVPIGPSDLGTFRAAMAFTPTVSGDAQLLSMRGRCVIPYPSGTTCYGIGEVAIQSDAGGKPSGTTLGSMGFYLTDSLSNGTPVEQQCGTISPSPHLTAGTKYWAVMTSPDQIDWLDWTDVTANVLQSLDDQPWTTAFNPKTLALRIDSGADTCLPVAEPNPVSGTTIGEMYVHTGAQTFNTVTATNSGVAPLTLGGATFTGADPAVFSVKDGEPGPLARPFRFPREVGVGSTTILYVTCTGAATERWYYATLTLPTSDPALPNVTYPLECLVDNTPPTVEFSQSPNGLAGWWTSAAATLGVRGVDPESGNRVKLISCGNSIGSMSPGVVFGGAMSASIAGEGVHAISCSAVDVANNASGGFPTEVKIDSRPPVPVPEFAPSRTVDGWNRTPTTLSFVCDDPVPGSGVATPATGGGTVTTETAGTDFTSAGCTDVAGHISTPVTATIRIDMTAPVVTSAGVTPAPNAAGWNNSDATVSFDCTDTGAVQSGIKTPSPDVVVATETSEAIVTSNGCTDKASNDAASPASQVVKLDKTAPSTVVDSGPAAVTNAATANFALQGDDALSGLAGFECRHDGGAFAPCTSPVSLSGLTDGEHSFSARAIDVAGNVDATPASRTWTVDTIPPDTSIVSAPATATAATSAAFSYSGDALGGSAIGGFECSLDGAAFTSCPSSGKSYSGLADGEHSFDVRALDAAGNADGTPASHTWTVDTIPPQTSVDSAPAALTGSASASFTYSGDALAGSAIAGFECSLDGAAFASCPSNGKSYSTLGDGQHSFEVRALDAAGNADGTPASHTWTVDTIPPATSVDSSPGAVTTATSATFTYSGDALGGSPVASFECSLDGAAFTSCQSNGESYFGLAGGEHSFQVRALDAAGNADATPAEFVWSVDLLGPTTTITSGPASLTGDTGATFTFTAVDAGGSSVAGFECRLDGALFGPCTSLVAYAGLAVGRHTFQVRASDLLGNVENPPASFSWTIAPFGAADDAASTLEDTPVTVDVGANDARPSGVAVTIKPTNASSANGGTVSSNGDQSLRYAPPANFNGTDTFTYTASADGFTTASATVTVRVAAVNDAPRFTRGAPITVDEDSGAYTVAWASAISAGPSDEAEQQVRFAIRGNSNPGLFNAAPSLSPTGVLSFTPAPNANGAATIDAQLVDDGGTANGGSDAAAPVSLTITVRPVDDAPTIAVARGIDCNGTSGTLHLVVNDIDNASSSLALSGSASSGQAGLAVGGAGSDRTMTITRMRRASRATVTVRVSDGSLSSSSPIALIVGSTRGERIDGGDEPDLIFGLGGRDRISGGGGNDLICGGDGSDTMNGGAGDDVLRGGRGNDAIRGGDGNDVLRGGSGADRLFGGPGDDILRGGQGADLFVAAPGADTLLDFNASEGDRR